MPPRPTMRTIWKLPTRAPMSGSTCGARGSSPSAVGEGPARPRVRRAPPPALVLRSSAARAPRPGRCRVGGSATFTRNSQSVADAGPFSCPAQGVRRAAAVPTIPLTVPGSESANLRRSPKARPRGRLALRKSARPRAPAGGAGGRRADRRERARAEEGRPADEGAARRPPARRARREACRPGGASGRARRGPAALRDPRDGWTSRGAQRSWRDGRPRGGRRRWHRAGAGGLLPRAGRAASLFASTAIPRPRRRCSDAFGEPRRAAGAALAPAPGAGDGWERCRGRRPGPRARGQVPARPRARAGSYRAELRAVDGAGRSAAVGPGSARSRSRRPALRPSSTTGSSRLPWD